MGQSALDDYYRLHFRGNRLYGELARILGETPQTLFLMRLLLGNETGLSQSEICASLSVPKQTMSRILKGLVQEGRVQESPSPSDGRGKLFALTAVGKRRAQNVIGRLNDIENACLTRSSDELDAVNRYNERYLDALQECIENKQEVK